MRRHIPLITVFVCQVLVAALLLFLYFVTRPAFADVFRDYAGTIPTLAGLSLSSWYLPALAAFPLAADLIALAMPKRSLRNATLGFGLVVPAFGLVLAAFGMFVPLFEFRARALTTGLAGAAPAGYEPCMRFVHAVASSVFALALAGCTSQGGGSDSEDPEDVLACDPAAAASRTISCVQDFSPGEGAGFGQEEYPQIIYGEPAGTGTYSGSLDVLSLGKGGSVTVGFGGGAIEDGPGPDLIVFENAFYKGNKPEYPFHELGSVSISDDGETWSTFECRDAAYPFQGCAGWRAILAGSEPGIDAYDPEQAGGDPFDLADLGLARARFVRIVDISNFGGEPNAGFDLDAITIVHASP